MSVLFKWAMKLAKSEDMIAEQGLPGKSNFLFNESKIFRSESRSM